MSDNILKQLYRGEYFPQEEPFYPDEDYKRMMAQKKDMENRFEKALPEKLREEFKRYLHLCVELDIADEEIAFFKGVRLGIKLMECVGE